MEELPNCKLPDLDRLQLTVRHDYRYIDICCQTGEELLTKVHGKEWTLGIDIAGCGFRFNRANVLELFTRGNAVDAYLAANPLPEE